MNELTEYIRMAFESIRHNRGRSVLTMLGIVIGITSVITIALVGSAFSENVSDTLKLIGGGQIYLYAGEDATAADEWITEEDLRKIEAQDGVEGATPYFSVGGTTETKKGSFSLSITGGTPILGKIQYSNMQITKGRDINGTDVSDAGRICVLKRSDALKLFGTDDVIGMRVPIKSGEVTLNFTIVGLREEIRGRENAAVELLNSSDSVGVDVPMTAMADWGYDMSRFDGVYLLCDGTRNTNLVAESVLALMKQRHPSADGAEYFQIQDFSDTFNQMTGLMRTVTTFVMLVAAISLAVGGIGVMNIMLVSVVERTREIGIRKSIGATTASITVQFLSESAIISGVGGAVGIGGGILLSAFLCHVLNLTLVILPSVVIVAAAVSMGIGMFFGIYPARKAAHMNPIEALRHE
jgi:putative ABC transport system permease protein